MEKPGDIVIKEIEEAPNFVPDKGAIYQIGNHRYKILKAGWTGFCAIGEVYRCECKYLGKTDEPSNFLKD